MNYTEIKGDLFALCKYDYALAHCISADFALGAGIAKEFERRFKIRERLIGKFGAKWYEGFDKRGGTCIACGPFSFSFLDVRKVMVFNLVTKKRYWEKPTMENMKKALIILRRQCEKYDIKKLAMPKIGCGLDGLYWNVVSHLIQEVFYDSDIEITVCFL